MGGLATIFTMVHVAGILANSYVRFDLMSVLVPFASTWRPAAVAWGICGLYLLLAIELTSLFRSRVSRPLWRATHFASFPLFVLSTVHALAAGADAGTWLFEIAASLSVMTVGLLTAYRFVRSSGRSVQSGKPVRNS